MALAFLLVLGPLVVVHELGHYLVGRWFGVRADVFSIGFGKELWGRTDKRGTRWRVAAIPLGGFVQFAGDMNASSMPDPNFDQLSAEQKSGTFHAAKLWHRALIVFAGPLTNLLVAIGIFFAFNLAYGKMVEVPEVTAFAEKSDGISAGIQLGDRITAIDGNAIASATEIPEHIVAYPGRTVAVEVERDGRKQTIPVSLTPQDISDQFGNKARVADLGLDFASPHIRNVVSGSPAEKAGLAADDRILAINNSPVASFREVRTFIRAHPSEPATITVRRDGEEKRLKVMIGSIKATDEEGKPAQLGQIGIAYGKVLPVGVAEAATMSVDQSVAIVKMMVTGIAQIITGERSVKELGGPLKIAKYSGEQLSLGLEPFVWFTALISINLAFINLLPIPALDGGHLAFYAAEAVRRKPVSLRGQEWAFRTGMALVLALMLFVTVNDLLSFNLFG